MTTSSYLWHQIGYFYKIKSTCRTWDLATLMTDSTTANRAWRGACPSSPLSSSDDSSPDSRDGSPNYSRPVSSRASRSCDMYNRHLPRGPGKGLLKVDDVTVVTDGEAAPVAHWAFASAAVKATGPTRGKSPFWVTSADNVHGQQQQPTNHEQIRLATAGAGEAQQVERESSVE
ncbi:hypothetical protein HPB50_012062 [Hyalomma asiaticum]|uniref:Uncharacterized protein n=1 Tax=Hyalomma asiaticum TaxID=266040 RepID=A0ACB7T268_HYAAI|nr:hypothetical protein HPB50_012062 [Hyalomma asiaticum]